MYTTPFEAEAPPQSAEAPAKAAPQSADVAPDSEWHRLRADGAWCTCGQPRESCVRSQVRTLFEPLRATPDEAACSV